MTILVVIAFIIVHGIHSVDLIIIGSCFCSYQLARLINHIVTAFCRLVKFIVGSILTCCLIFVAFIFVFFTIVVLVSYMYLDGRRL